MAIPNLYEFKDFRAYLKTWWEAEKARHKYAWVPFGGGAHMCLGLHFAYMQVKVLMTQLLSRYRIELSDGANVQWQPWPIPKPRDGLRVVLTPV